LPFDVQRSDGQGSGLHVTPLTEDVFVNVQSYKEKIINKDMHFNLNATRSTMTDDFTPVALRIYKSEPTSKAVEPSKWATVPRSGSSI